MKICSVSGCNGKHKGLGFCAKHYCQYKRHGKIMDNEPKNEIILYEDCAEVVIYNREGEEVGRVLIDKEDVEKIKNYKWSMGNGYVYNGTVGKMHRFLMNCPSNKIVDHINHNTLDNRKTNLRICTQTENCMNRNKRKNTTSQYKGVCWDKQRSKWSVQIAINNKRKYVGLYDSEFEASIEYDRYAIMYHGIYCKTNHPIENYIDYIIGLGLDPTDFGIEEDGADI